MSKVSIFKIRIIKAIKHGNNEERYIIEADEHQGFKRYYDDEEEDWL